MAKSYRDKLDENLLDQKREAEALGFDLDSKDLLPKRKESKNLKIRKPDVYDEEHHENQGARASRRKSIYKHIAREKLANQELIRKSLEKDNEMDR